MMQICYNDAGLILFTVNGDEVPEGLTENWISYDGPALGVLSGWRVIDKTLVLVDMGPAKADAVAKINSAVGRARLPYLTDIAGQQAIYAEKAAEAKAYVALILPPLTMTDFPMLEAEIGITAPDAGQLAQVWLNMVALLRVVGAQSEQVRLGAMNLINAATTLGEIDAILDEFSLE